MLSVQSPADPAYPLTAMITPWPADSGTTTRDWNVPPESSLHASSVDSSQSA
jgi:hypothetical protein